ncbi:glutamate receptor 1-like [Panulirus ornatus]|uniref:glutamate receptor 1-like n=1 Tax=Panulirus ornatus TaxID=150431 RepID=UPI003A89B4D3
MNSGKAAGLDGIKVEFVEKVVDCLVDSLYTTEPMARCLVYWQVMAGLWLLSCVIVSTAYRSSLVAHLIVQDKMPTINNFQDLLDRDGWGWGTSFSSGSIYTFFKTHPYSDIKEIFRNMQFAPAEEQFQRVLEGSYSHITNKHYGLGIVASSFTDRRGYTPIHTGRSEHIQYVGKGWAFRRGAPFRQRFSRMIQHMVEGGLVDHWRDDIIASHMRVARERRESHGKTNDGNFQVVDNSVSLALVHLQGAFYLMLLGSGVAFLTLVGENLAAHCCS